jgi:hypothetical protein
VNRLKEAVLWQGRPTPIRADEMRLGVADATATARRFRDLYAKLEVVMDGLVEDPHDGRAQRWD